MTDPAAPAAAADEPWRVAAVLVPNFSLMAYASTIEPLRAANYVTGRQLYSWRNLSSSGGVVTASNHLDVLTEPIAGATDPLPHMVVVCGGIDTDRHRDRHLEAELRRLARGGTVIAAVSTGSFVLARAGLLDGYRCTVHWECMDAFVQAFPQLTVENRLFVIDGPRITCAGASAAIDLMLELLRRRHGETLSAQVAEQFVHGRGREADTAQRLDARYRYGVRHPQLSRAIALMEQTLAFPLPKREIAARVGISARQLERLFKQELGRSPSRFYMALRLERARRLLRQTAMSVTEVAFACGFETASHFAKCYKEAFGERPSRERRNEPAGNGRRLW